VKDAVQEKLALLPGAPGVYVFRDRAGAPLYVGKASNLRSRVRSYFQVRTGDSRFFVERLARELGDIETFVTATEKEAALLENSLIKEHRPRYNVKLRDDKEFLSLRLDPKVDWPRLEVVRRPKPDGARYFGPYHSATAARSTLRLVNRHFRLRTCTDADFRARTRPCLQYQIARCPAPCVYEVDRAEYARQRDNVGLFLEGRHDELLQDLNRSMREAARGERYEQAATYRDQIRAVESARQQQRVSLVTRVDQDVFGFFRADDKAEVAVVMARRGRVVAVRTFALRDARLPDDELVASFVGEYYRRGSFVPHEVLIPTRIEAAGGLEGLLSEQRDARVRLLRPERGAKARLVRLAMENAAHAFREKARAREDAASRLGRLGQRLGLSGPPRRIECMDVSHLGGADTVAVIVAVTDGVPDPGRYRSFRVRGVHSGDDYAAMHEVLSRRFRRAARGDGGWEAPDLIVVDGGKGQLAIALRALRELGVEGIACAALAKERESVGGESLVDRVYVPGRKNPIAAREGDTLSILIAARDEAHRASNALRVKVGTRRGLRSGLDEVPGVGPRTRAALLRALGSLRAVRAADVDALVRAGATRTQAEAIRRAFEDPARIEDAAVDNAFASDGS
jgi:excinuclease ABC subunit C